MQWYGLTSQGSDLDENRSHRDPLLRRKPSSASGAGRSGFAPGCGQQFLTRPGPAMMSVECKPNLAKPTLDDV